MHPKKHTCEQVIEERIDMGITDLEIAREQLYRHINEMKGKFDTDDVLSKLEECIQILLQIH